MLGPMMMAAMFAGCSQAAEPGADPEVGLPDGGGTSPAVDTHTDTGDAPRDSGSVDSADTATAETVGADTSETGNGDTSLAALETGGDTAVAALGDTGLDTGGLRDTGGPVVLGRCGPTPNCVDLDTQPLLWTFVAGADMLTLDLNGDMNGDGYVDAIVRLRELDVTTYLVYGPLNRPLTLPTDADVTIPGQANPVGDLNGDDLHDLYYEAGGGYSLLLAPYAAVVDPAVDAEPVLIDWGTFRDLDGDGVSDRQKNDDNSTSIWFADYATWHTRPADLILRSDCNGFKFSAEPQVDSDSDGIRELWVYTSFFDVDCQHFRVPASLRGTVTVETHPDSVLGNRIDSVGDQDLDGSIDVTLLGVDEVWSRPVTFDAAGDATPASIMFSTPYSHQVLPLDLNGDGIADFSNDSPGCSGGCTELQVYTGGLGGGANLDAPSSSILYSTGSGSESRTASFIEDGRGYQILFDALGDDSVRLVDFGPAVAVPMQ